MAIPEHDLSRTRAGTTILFALLIVVSSFISGCLQGEPEELSFQVQSTLPLETNTPVAPAAVLENPGSARQLISITSPKQSRIFTDLELSREVESAISDFAEGKTTDTINGYLRWESVRARTNQSDSARIRDQIHRIDYALYNTTLQENISVYIGITGEQSKKILNGSVYTESGYGIGSYDPSVVYHALANNGRDSEGYFTMCVIDLRRGSRILFVNATEREVLLPRGGIWDLAREERYETLEFSPDTIPRYKDLLITKVRLISTKEHP